MNALNSGTTFCFLATEVEEFFDKYPQLLNAQAGYRCGEVVYST